MAKETQNDSPRSEDSLTALGRPVPADAGSIERELSSLWKTASTTSSEPSRMRACSCNLVVIAHGRDEAEDVLPILARVAQWQPARSIIAFREYLSRDDNSASMGAWVNTQCFVPFEGAPEVCCEVISLAASGGSGTELANALVSVLVPDLPVFLYWRSFRPQEQDLVERIVSFAHLLIVDSHVSKDDPGSRERVLDLLRHPPNRILVRDLNWSRLTAWRELITQFFDTPEHRHHVWEISEMEVCRVLDSSGSIPTRTLLLTGWLATRLRWRRSFSERRGDEWVSRWNTGSGELEVHLTGSPHGPGEVPGIQSVTLRTRSGARFAVVQDPVSACMTATATVGGSVLSHTVPRDALGEDSLIARELSIAGEDRGFHLALTEALALEKSFR